MNRSHMPSLSRGELNQQRIKVDRIIESVRMTLGPLIAETRGRIVCGPLPEVDADPVLLESVLQNLVSNALRYHRPGEAPVIEISGGKSGDSWQFVVKDDGGEFPNHQDRVFEPLKRLHGNDIPGSGLGLALCRTIVARHAGRIWVESKGEGHGATFRFTLLAAEAPSLLHTSAVS